MSKPAKAPTTADIEVGRVIKDARLAQRMSQTDLAKACGVTFQQVQKYERGTNRVSAGRLASIADALAMPMSVFFGSDQLGEPDEFDAAARLLAVRIAKLEERDRIILLQMVEALDRRRVLRPVKRGSLGSKGRSRRPTPPERGSEDAGS